MPLPSSTFEFTDQHRVAAVNLAQAYENWLESARRAAALDFGFQVKEQHHKDTTYRYLYRITDRRGNGRSLGALNEELRALQARHAESKAQARAREASLYTYAMQAGAVYRAMRLGVIASEAANILRFMDLYGLLGHRFMVVGTNAMAAYELEANLRFAATVESTEDVDLAWTSQTVSLIAGTQPSPWNTARILGLPDDDPLVRQANPPAGTLREVLQRIDSTYTKNTERPFQLRNAKGYEVEVLLAQSMIRRFPAEEALSPIPLEEQDWLLLGSPVSHVIAGRDGTPARVVAPDPRYFGLQKIWLSKKPQRLAAKKPKDLRQGMLVLNAVRDHMPHMPIDASFAAALPAALIPAFSEWQAQYDALARERPAGNERPRW
jgi:hypothetical protein